MMKRFVLAVLFCAVALAALPLVLASQAAKPVWLMKDCFTLDDVTMFLNTLPADRAIDAKVLAINSQWSFLGMASTPYYVWYRK